MLRVVLDTSVLVSTLLVPDGVPAQVLSAWRANYFALFASPAIRAELLRVSALPRIRRRYRVTDEQVAKLVGLLDEWANWIEGTADTSDAPLRDSQDFIILSAAADADADVLVSSDQDLLVLGRYRRARIVTPRQFLLEYVPPGVPRRENG